MKSARTLFLMALVCGGIVASQFATAPDGDTEIAARYQTRQRTNQFFSRSAAGAVRRS